MKQVYERRRKKSNQIYQNLLELLDQVFKSTINSPVLKSFLRQLHVYTIITALQYVKTKLN